MRRYQQLPCIKNSMLLVRSRQQFKDQGQMLVSHRFTATHVVVPSALVDQGGAVTGEISKRSGISKGISH